MASQQHPQRWIRGFLARFNKPTYGSLFQFTTTTTNTHLVLETHSPDDINSSEKRPNHENSQSSVVVAADERRVLTELSELLPIHPRPPPRHLVYSENVGFKAVDGFLAPEEKLRGVFLQRLRGKAAVERALSRCVGVDLTLDTVAKVLGRGNLGGEAMVAFFSWAIKQPTVPKDVGSYNVVMEALGRRKFFEFLDDVLREMNAQGVRPDCETLLVVMDSYARAHRVNKAIKLFGNLEEFGMSRDTRSLNVLLRCLCQRSHVGSANSLFNAMKGKIPFDATTYNLIISGWSKFGRVREMERSLAAMVEDGFPPDCSTFSYLIEGLGRAGQMDGAVAVFNSVTRNGCVPDAGVYNAMISNFISVGNFNQCMEYYQQMLSSNYGPNMDTYTKLIAAFLKHCKVADALEMFDEMLSRGIVPSTGTITSFIKPLCSYGPPHAAMMMYKKARHAGCGMSMSAYKLLFMRLSRFGKCRTLFVIWDAMQEDGHSPDIEVYEYVINGLCNVGLLEKAVFVMEEALRMGFCPSRLICSKLNIKLLNSNRVGMAYKLFQKTKRARHKENERRNWRSKGWHF